MGQGAQAVKVEKTRGPFDGVDGAKDGGQQLAAVRVALQGHEVAVELVQVFLTLDQELLEDFIHGSHERSPFPPPAAAGENTDRPAAGTAQR